MRISLHQTTLPCGCVITSGINIMPSYITKLWTEELHCFDHRDDVQALRAQWLAKQELRKVAISRALVWGIQEFFRNNPVHNRKISFPCFEIFEVAVYPTDTPMVKWFVLPQHHKCHNVKIICHIDDLMTTLEALDTVDLMGMLD